MIVRRRVAAILPFAMITMSGALPSCSSPQPSGTSPPASNATPAVTPPALGADKPSEYPGLHNVVAYHEGFYSGSVPEANAGFQTLSGMGVKTIISVDGAEPDVAAARALGIRYIHLPIGYNGYDEERKRELVRATRDAMLAGPVYIHCHHGKHRSAGAAGAVSASLGWLTPEAAVERMKVSGTAPNYKGLYACTAESSVMQAQVIDAVPANFPEVSHPAGFVKSMVEIDEINERLKLIEKAGWVPPQDHPDLVPAAEAGRMSDLLRFADRSELTASKPAEFGSMLKSAEQEVRKLEDMLAAGKPDPRPVSAQFALVAASCKNCHAKYRD